jgi:hypothetical protein
MAVGLGRYGLNVAICVVPVSNKAFQPADTNRFATRLNSARAFAFALRFLRTNSAANSGKRGGLSNDLIRSLKVELAYFCYKLRDMNFYRATGNTGHGLTSEASRRLVDSLLLAISKGYLLEHSAALYRIKGGHRILFK